MLEDSEHLEFQPHYGVHGCFILQFIIWSILILFHHKKVLKED